MTDGWSGRNRAGQRGVSMTELVITTAVTGVLVLMGVPMVDDARRAAELSRSTAQIHGLLIRCRAVAVVRSRMCAVVFNREADGGWSCVVAEDGDGDGVRRIDISRGTDPTIGPTLSLEAGAAGPGILDGSVPDPSGSGGLRGDPADPIRAGRGNMVSFSARGTATPSSVYLTDHARRMVAIRVYGGTGRINRIRWQRGWSEWKQ
jgi:hypothetical protein